VSQAAVVAKEMGSLADLPGFVAVPNQGKNPTGYLGVEYGPFETGEAPFSQSCLLATRLVESGVRFVTVNHGGWDTHANNFTRIGCDGK
jgi:hypothetical protein